MMGGFHVSYLHGCAFTAWIQKPGLNMSEYKWDNNDVYCNKSGLQGNAHTTGHAHRLE
jgi:hypothetical protein